MEQEYDKKKISRCVSRQKNAAVIIRVRANVRVGNRVVESGHGRNASRFPLSMYAHDFCGNRVVATGSESYASEKNGYFFSKGIFLTGFFFVELCVQTTIVSKSDGRPFYDQDTFAVNRQNSLILISIYVRS